MSQDFIAFDGFEVAVDLDRWPAKILRALLRRHYEKHELRLVSRLLSSQDRVIELGSAIGVVALAASRTVPPEQIFCFDANPEMVATATANFEHAGKTISAHNAVMMAGTSAPETVTFYKTPYFLSSSLSPDTVGARPVEVKTLQLGSIISEQAANVLIVDIEGGEFDLLGATDLSAVETLVLEIHVSTAGVDACLTLISDLQRQGLALDADLTGHNVFVFTRTNADDLPQGRNEIFAEAYLTALEASDAGRRSEAIGAIGQAIEANPQNAHAHLLLSQLAISEGPVERALEAAETAATLDPLNEDAFEQLGVLYSALGEFEKSGQAYTRAIALAPQRPLFHMGLGAVLVRQGKDEQALTAFRSAAALCPLRATTLDFLLDLSARQDKSPDDVRSAPSQRTRERICARSFLQHLGPVVAHGFRFPDAASALSHALELAPDDAALQCGLAALVATPKDIREALELTLPS